MLPEALAATPVLGLSSLEAGFSSIDEEILSRLTVEQGPREGFGLGDGGRAERDDLQIAPLARLLDAEAHRRPETMIRRLLQAETQGERGASFWQKAPDLNELNDLRSGCRICRASRA